VYFFLSQRFSFLSLRGSEGGSWLQEPTNLCSNFLQLGIHTRGCP
jgi:hypothetical protein